jgi:hypothetical protein
MDFMTLLSKNIRVALMVNQINGSDMKTLFLLTALSLALVACSPEPPSKQDMVSQYLGKNGVHVVDVSPLGDISSTGSSSPPPPVDLCLSAPNAFSFRGVQQDGHTLVGVACVEQDNTVIIPMSKVM